MSHENAFIKLFEQLIFDDLMQLIDLWAHLQIKNAVRTPMTSKIKSERPMVRVQREIAEKYRVSRPAYAMNCHNQGLGITRRGLVTAICLPLTRFYIKRGLYVLDSALFIHLFTAHLASHFKRFERITLLLMYNNGNIFYCKTLYKKGTVVLRGETGHSLHHCAPKVMPQ